MATIVTGFWNISSKYSGSNSYTGWMRNALRINAPFIFFYDRPEVRDFVEGVRDGLPTTTMVYRNLTDKNFSSITAGGPSFVHSFHLAVSFSCPAID